MTRSIALVDGYLTFLKNNTLVAWIDDPFSSAGRIECINRWEQDGLVPSDAKYPGDEATTA